MNFVNSLLSELFYIVFNFSKLTIELLVMFLFTNVQRYKDMVDA